MSTTGLHEEKLYSEPALLEDNEPPPSIFCKTVGCGFLIQDKLPDSQHQSTCVYIYIERRTMTERPRNKWYSLYIYWFPDIGILKM